jgi:hypothetical protein
LQFWTGKGMKSYRTFSRRDAKTAKGKIFLQ